jgi:hypothetical protein
VGVNEYDDAIDQLGAAMRFKLVLNRHKGDLAAIPLPDLISNLKAEVDELAEACATGSREEIMLEAADVANFALAAFISAVRAKRIGQ